MNYRLNQRLQNLIKNLSPELNHGEYVFCKKEADPALDDKEILALFRESEGDTIVIKKKIADLNKLPYQTVLSWITLRVGSELEDVGLTAVVSDALARCNISCNVIAGLHHDHLFVPINAAEEAIKVLMKLASEK